MDEYVERTPFKPRSLIQEAGLGVQAEDDVFTDASFDVVRSVKSYKGKLFLLVCGVFLLENQHR